MKIFKIIICFFFVCSTNAENYVIMDDETESFLSEIVNHVKDALHYEKDIKVYVSSDQTINASAIETGDIVINAGAIIQSKNYEELIAILAHEVGHIEGLHISTYMANRIDFMKAGLVTTLIGAIASVCSGHAEPLLAGVVGGQSMGSNMALSKLRQKENIADTKAADAIKRLNWSVFGGFVSIHEKLASGNLVYNKYFSTHPQSEDRISKFKNYLYESNSKKVPESIVNLMKKYERKFEIIKYKLRALTFQNEFLQTFYRNPKTQNETYARAIALYRLNKYEDSIKLANKLISENRRNKAYYLEIKCMCLINLKKCKKAADIAWDVLKNNRKTKVHRDLGIIYAVAVINGNLKKHFSSAIKVLKKILVIHDDFSALNTLGKLYTMSNDHEKASLCAAEMALKIGDISTAKIHATKALFSSDSNTKRRARDILNSLDIQ